MRSNDNLKAEYLLIQSHYEAFDQRALGLKALATPLLGAALVAGLKDEGNALILVATIAVTLCLWLLESIWKAFQYCLTDRIKALEDWFEGGGDEGMAPFQIYRSWGILYRKHFSKPGVILSLMKEPFVCLPYAVMLVLGVIGLGTVVGTHHVQVEQNFSTHKLPSGK